MCHLMRWLLLHPSCGQGEIYLLTCEPVQGECRLQNSLSRRWQQPRACRSTQTNHGQVQNTAKPFLHQYEHARCTKRLLLNADAGLVRDVAPHCPDWSSAVAATEAAAAEAQKLQREVRLLESKWLQPQVERARAVAYAEHQGDPASASRFVEQLDIAGLSNATEEDLLHRAVKVLDSVHEETGKNEGAANNAGSSMHHTQVMHAMVVKDLALACACSKKIVEAAQHMARSLKLSSEVRAHLSADDVEQLRQVAQAVWEHCVRSVRSADTEQGAQDAVNAGTELAAVLVDFNGGSFNI